MRLTPRILVIMIGILIIVNGSLAWYLWSTYVAPQHMVRSRSTTTQTRPTTITAACRTSIQVYIDQSNARMYTYFALRDQLTISNQQQLAARVYALSKEYAALPDNCPASVDAALHANYISVYSSAPIHLHRYFSTATDLPDESINQRIAWRYFEREADTAEQSMYQLLRLIQ